MKRTWVISALLLGMNLCFAVPSFPGAEGFGAVTPGGRGGKVLIVTNTNSTGPGSLYAAVNTAGPRIIVFRTSGVINIQSGTAWYFENANLAYMTIAGQTSPGGITLTAPGSYQSSLFNQYQANKTHDFIWRFLRFRANGQNEHSIQQYENYNFIFDHCDFSGGQDEIADMAECHDLTVQWCAVANDLHVSGSWGGLFFSTYTGVMNNLSVHHVLIADDFYRAPAFFFHHAALSANTMIDFRNNVMYNIPGDGHTCIFGYDQGTPMIYFNLVGNYTKDGPAGTQNTAYPPFAFSGGATVFEQDNVWDAPIRKPAWVSSNPGDTVFDTRYRPVLPRSAMPYATPQVTTTSAKQAYLDVLNKVGAWPRDSMTRRNVNDVRTGIGHLYDVSDPLITSGPAAPADADNDGIPDFWETAMGLNPNDSTDAAKDFDGTGYTNIEKYINDLALARLCQDYYYSVYPIPSNWPDYDPSCCKSLSIETHSSTTAGQPRLLVSPNPYFAGTIHIGFQNDKAITGTVNIFNASGQSVARIPAAQTVAWNGLTGRNSRIPAGIYLVRWMEGSNLLAQKKIMVIR
jgi:hypothetical protein